MYLAGEQTGPGLEVGNSPLSLEQVGAVAWHRQPVVLAADACRRVFQSRQAVEAALQTGLPLYGINTGFGSFADVRISPAETRQLQINLLRSHAAGVGSPLPRPVVRAMVLLRVNALAAGYSGIRPQVLERLLLFLQHDICPVVPAQGSLGASGDLAPLAHLALPLIGEGQVHWRGQCWPAAAVLSQLGLEPLVLEAKEGLALINGTQAMTALGVLAWLRARQLALAADVIASLTIQALRGIPAAFQLRIQNLRPQRGQVEVAANLLQLLQDSCLTTLPGQLRTQDAYSLRCIPQVHGAYRAALDYVGQILRCEVNAVTDNPLVFVQGGDMVSGGNFHGQPVAQALDLLAIAIADLGNVSERRTERLVNPHLSGLPAFLTNMGGLHSGLMLAQYTTAALASENKTLATPASVDTIPSSAGQEDHVSMGTLAARQAWAAVQNLQNILAIELVAACQAVEFYGSNFLSPPGQAVYNRVRQVIPPLLADRPLAPDLARAADLLAQGQITAAATTAVAPNAAQAYPV